jgi:hypothetical protein
MLRNGLADQFDNIFIFCPTVHFNDSFLEFFTNLTPLQEARLNDRDELDTQGNPTGEKMTLLPLTTRNKFKCFDHISGDQLDDLIQAQKSAVTNVRERKAVGLMDKREPSTLFIFDDMIDNEVLNFWGEMNKVAYLGRHFRLSFIVLTQHLNKVSKGIRLNSDLFIILAPFAMSELESFLEQFTIRQMRSKAMKMFFETFSQPFQFIVLFNFIKDPFNRIGTSIAQEFIGHTIEDLHMFDMRQLLKDTKKRTKKSAEEKTAL